jgi:hypothetical protein
MEVPYVSTAPRAAFITSDAASALQLFEPNISTCLPSTMTVGPSLESSAL